MDCSWVKSLRGIQVPCQPQCWFILPVILNRMMVDALIDTGCGRTLVKEAKGPFTWEILHMKCIHGDVRDYKTKWVEIQVGRQPYQCRVGVVPCLDYAVFIGRDCPVIQELLRKGLLQGPCWGWQGSLPSPGGTSYPSVMRTWQCSWLKTPPLDKRGSPPDPSSRTTDGALPLSYRMVFYTGG